MKMMVMMIDERLLSGCSSAFALSCISGLLHANINFISLPVLANIFRRDQRGGRARLGPDARRLPSSQHKALNQTGPILGPGSRDL